MNLTSSVKANRDEKGKGSAHEWRWKVRQVAVGFLNRSRGVTASGKPGVLHPEAENWFAGGGADWKIRTNTHITKQKPALYLVSIPHFLQTGNIRHGVQQSFSVLWSIRAEDSFRLDFLNRISSNSQDENQTKDDPDCRFPAHSALHSA